MEARSAAWTSNNSGPRNFPYFRRDDDDAKDSGFGCRVGSGRDGHGYGRSPSWTSWRRWRLLHQLLPDVVLPAELLLSAALRRLQHLCRSVRRLQHLCCSVLWWWSVRWLRLSADLLRPDLLRPVALRLWAVLCRSLRMQLKLNG